MQQSDNSLEFNYFENIVEASAAGIIIVDAQGIIKKSNPVFNALVGYTQNQPTGKSFIEFVHKNKKVKKLDVRVVVWVILYLSEHTGEDFQSEVFLVT